MLELVTALLLMHSAPKAVPAEKLAPEILKVSAEYGMDPVLITQIILVESAGVPSAKNDVTHDYGLMQINLKTAKALKVPETCLWNWKCNLKVGVGLLAMLKKRSDFRACQYNLGPRGSKLDRRKKCLQYEKKLDKIVYKESI